MKKTGRSASFFLWVPILLALAGCGGGDGGTAVSTKTILIAGVVEDGPIENARVALHDSGGILLSLCGPRGGDRCETVSDGSGAFSLHIKKGTGLGTLSIHAIGGRDRATGADFDGMELQTSLAPFTDSLTKIVVSPLTTLTALLQAQGWTSAAAQELLVAWLSLPPGVTPLDRPSSHLDLQRRTLLLSEIALLLPAALPFGDIAAEVAKEGTPLFNADGSCNAAVLTTLGLDAAGQAEIIRLQTALVTAATVEGAAFVYKSEKLQDVFAENIEAMLAPATLDPLDPAYANYRANLRTLAETTLQAAGDEVILLSGVIPQRIARYILFTYQLRTWAALTVDPASFAESLQPLASDSKVAELAALRSLYSVISPLLLDELPGNDNQKRLAYFYGSDLSPHYQAEMLIGQVFDDVVNDAVLLKVVEGKANAGLIDEARALIDTQIMQSEQKANGYRLLGGALIGFGRMAEARDELLKARQLYFSVINSKGVASASSTDIINLQATARDFRKAGYLADAQTVLDYLALVTQSGDANTYGRLVVETGKVADAYIAAGDLTAAAPVVDALYDYARAVPPNLVSGVTTYKLRIYSLCEAAKRYATLGNREIVLQIYDLIQSQRAADGYQNKTGPETWVYMPGLVETLYRVGDSELAFSLANSIPDSYVNAAGTTISGITLQASAFKLVATIEALGGNLGTAFTLVDNNTYFPKPEDKVDALTYKESNKQNEYIGLALINNGRFSEARLALEQAEVILAATIKTTDADRYTYLIQRGYVKVADLYAMIGDTGKAEQLLQQGQGVVPNLAGVKYAVTGLVDIALGYQKIGQPVIAADLLQIAVDKIDAAAGTLAKPEDAVLIYEVLTKAYLQIGDKLRAHGIMTAFLSWSRAIHTPGYPYTGTANDDLAAKEIDWMIRGSEYLMSAGFRNEALAVLDEAQATAALIWVESARLKAYIYPDPLINLTKRHLVGGYANARAYSQALALAIGLPYTSNRNDAIAFLADSYIRRDDFPATTVASIDTDGDGRPDFFHPLASPAEISASGLLLDDDSDGDGIVDTLDLRPLFAD